MAGTETQTATVVLVHGAFHGAWCWDRVVPRLEDAGVAVVALDLPGHGADPAPPGDLHAHADFLRAYLESLPGPVVVVGHSYGGAVISDGAAGVPSVAHLVYLAAIVADAGETMTTIDVGGPSLGLGADISEVPAAMSVDDDGFLVIDPAVGVGAFYADCTDDDVAFALDPARPPEPGDLRRSPSGPPPGGPSRRPTSSAPRTEPWARRSSAHWPPAPPTRWSWRPATRRSSRHPTSWPTSSSGSLELSSCASQGRILSTLSREW